MVDLATIDKSIISRLPFEQQQRMALLIKRKQTLDGQKLFFHLYPDVTTMRGGVTFHSRDEYKKHIEFFKAGKRYSERCVMAANRVGKSFGMGGYETSAHLTGQYPDWWEGHTFDRPVKAWVAGKSNKTTRDIIQNILCGGVIGSNSNKRFDGTGLIPANLMGRITWNRGIADLIDTIKIKYKTGGDSLLTQKSYEQGRGAFEGDAIDVIWLDEECPRDIYEECLYRIMTTGGILYLTFTPLEGLSETVLQFLPEMNPDR